MPSSGLQKKKLEKKTNFIFLFSFLKQNHFGENDTFPTFIFSINIQLSAAKKNQWRYLYIQKLPIKFGKGKKKKSLNTICMDKWLNKKKKEIKKVRVYYFVLFSTIYEQINFFAARVQPVANGD